MNNRSAEFYAPVAATSYVVCQTVMIDPHGILSPPCLSTFTGVNANREIVQRSGVTCHPLGGKKEEKLWHRKCNEFILTVFPQGDRGQCNLQILWFLGHPPEKPSYLCGLPAPILPHTPTSLAAQLPYPYFCPLHLRSNSK